MVATTGHCHERRVSGGLPYVWFGLLVLAEAFLFSPLATWLPGLLGN